MITLTITLKNTPHQIVLGFKDRASVDATLSAMSRQASDMTTQINDDYGQQALFTNGDQAAIVITDLDRYTDFKINRIAWIKRGENAAQMFFEQRPDLKDYVGSDLVQMFSKDV